MRHLVIGEEVRLLGIKGNTVVRVKVVGGPRHSERDGWQYQICYPVDDPIPENYWWSGEDQLGPLSPLEELAKQAE